MEYFRLFESIAEANNVGDMGQLIPHVDMVSGYTVVNFYSANTNSFICSYDDNGKILIKYTLTLIPNPNGTVSGGGIYVENTTATITATPNSGYTFYQWSDGNTSATRQIKVTENITLSCEFKNVCTLTLVAGENGTVTGGGTFNYGTTVTFYATPNTHYQVNSWSDGNTAATRTITLTSNITLSCTFDVLHYIESGYDYGPGIIIDDLVFAPVNCGVGYNYAYPNGLLYQYGRRHGAAASESVTVSGLTYSQGQKYSNRKIHSYNNGEWWSTDSTSSTTDMGGWTYGSKGKYDPCPDGWRIPIRSEVVSLINYIKTLTVSEVQQKYYTGGQREAYGTINTSYWVWYWGADLGTPPVGAGRIPANSNNGTVSPDQYLGVACGIRPVHI